MLIDEAKAFCGLGMASSELCALGLLCFLFFFLKGGGHKLTRTLVRFIVSIIAFIFICFFVWGSINMTPVAPHGHYRP